MLGPDYRMLLGVDLVKEAERIVGANRELGGDFDLRWFQHEARHCEDPPRIEMRLRALRACAVRVEAGETILTEKSHKYTLPMLDSRVCGRGVAFRGAVGG
jgi:uncharacterized SAM-dependent methyltransferase